MKKLNMDNIAANLAIFDDAARDVSKLAYQEEIKVGLIDFAEDNVFGKNDTDEKVQELAKMIDLAGLINPLGVVKQENGRYRLFSGEKRFKAVRFLNWETVPCRVFEGDTPNMVQLKLFIANSEREYTAAEKLEIYEKLRAHLEKMKAEREFTGNISRAMEDLMQLSDRQVRKYRQMSEHLTANEKEALSAGQITVNEAAQIAVERKQEEKRQERLASPASSTDTAVPQMDPAPKKYREAFVELSEEEREALLFRYIPIMYNVKELYNYYKTEWPTPAEAIKAVLKPRYGSHGGGGPKYDFEQRSSKTYVSSKGNSKRDVIFTYSEIDAAIRQMFRDGILLRKKSKEGIA